MKRKTHFIKDSKAAIVKHGLSSFIAILVSSVVPMLQGWHADKEQAATLAAIEQRCNARTDKAEEYYKAQFADFKKEQADRDKAQWEALQKKQDRSMGFQSQ